MPYKRKSDLPEAVREALPAEAQEIYMGAFNGFMEQNPDADEGRGHAVAWAAVKRKFKKEGEKWVRKTEDAAEEFEFHDMVTLDGVRRTSDGYLTAVAAVARPGIQLYRGWEVGRPEVDTVRVYRPPEEVFAPDAMKSLAHRPVTLDHPPKEVNADNWKDYAVGQTGDEVDGRDGRYVRVPLVLMDAAAIKRVEDGHRQLSVGYHTRLEFRDGKTPDGEPFDAVQSAIRANHLAVVRAARGGPALRIGDDDPTNHGGKGMNMRNIMVDGVTVEVPDTAAQVIQRAAEKATQDMAARDQKITELEQKLRDAEAQAKADAEKAQADHKAAIDAKDAEIATKDQQLKDAEITPERLDALVDERQEVIAKAKAVVGDRLVADGRSVADIRKQAVQAKLGTEVTKDWDDKQIAVSFQTLTTTAVTGDAARQLGAALHRPGTPPNVAAYDERNKQLADAWRGPAPRQQ